MKEAIGTNKAPAALGPYSQAIRVQGRVMVYCSGQIPLDPATGEIVGGTAGEQCRQVMDNLGAVLEAAGLDFAHIVKTTIYLSDINEFGEINEVYGSYFREDPPARATLEARKLPKGAKLEIEAIAVAES